MKQYDEGGGVEGLACADSEVCEVLPPGVDRTEESAERGLLQRGFGYRKYFGETHHLEFSLSGNGLCINEMWDLGAVN